MAEEECRVSVAAAEECREQCRIQGEITLYELYVNDGFTLVNNASLLNTKVWSKYCFL